MMLTSGKCLGPYEILLPLGAGGMGEVYRAKDSRLDREVAIKVLPDRLAKDPDSLSRFEREAKAVAALSHPNILAIYDVGTEQGVSFVVTELLEGETLRDRIHGSPIPWRKAVEYGVAIADGLAAAHAKGVVHRDLKPENIFLTSDGVVKILDFGLARIEKPTTHEDRAAATTVTLDTKPGAVLGTVNYMSPEQVRGRKTDARSDIFSFGCVLYEMVTGKRAFSGETSPEMMTAILKEEPPSVVSSCPDVAPELDRVIGSCLAKKPEQRFHSAHDLAFTLRTILSDSSAFGGSKPTAAYAGPRMRTMLGVQVVVGVVAVMGLLVALNVGGWRERLFGRPAPGSIQSLAVLPLDNLSGDPEQEYFADGMTDALITNLSKIGALKVISRTSAMRYKGTDKLLPEIARELNVDAVVEGSVLRVGNRVRITAQLIEATTDRHLWAESYERDMRDVLAMQGEIARAIADQIQITLTPQEQQRLASAPSVNADAYQAYLRGKGFLERPDWSQEDLQSAVRMFDRAVRLDPDFALAYAELSFAHSSMHHFGHDPTEARASKAEAAVERSLELQPELPEAHLALGWYYYWCHREYDRALEEVAIAEKGLPNHTRLLDALGSIHRRRGRFERGLDYFRRAFELDPRSSVMAYEVGATNLYLRRYAEAEHYFDRSIAIAPDQILSYDEKATTHWVESGDTGKARAVLEEMTCHRNSHCIWTWFRQELFERNYQAPLERLASTSIDPLVEQSWFIPKAQLGGLVYQLMGEPERARAAYDSARVVLEEQLTERPDDHRVHSSLGVVYAALGRREDAIREGKLGVELFPVSKDALIGPYRVEDLAFIHVLLGEYDDALDEIEYLLSIPSLFSVPLLRLDPRWDPLRDHPRYDDLLRRFGPVP